MTVNNVIVSVCKLSCNDSGKSSGCYFNKGSRVFVSRYIKKPLQCQTYTDRKGHEKAHYGVFPPKKELDTLV